MVLFHTSHTSSSKNVSGHVYFNHMATTGGKGVGVATSMVLTLLTQLKFDMSDEMQRAGSLIFFFL